MGEGSTRRRRDARGVLLVALGVALVAAGCADEGPSEAASSTRAPVDERIGTSTPPEVDVTTTTQAVSAVESTNPGLELADSPVMLFLTGQTVQRFPDLAAEPEELVGSLERLDSFVVSPDGRHVAVAHAGDAVRPSRLELISAEDETVVAEVEVDADSLSIEGWSPDSGAVAARGRAGEWVSVSVDGTAQEVADYPYSYPMWVSSAETAILGPLDCEGCWMLQLQDAEGRPQVFVSRTTRASGVSATESGLWDPETDRVQPVTGDASGTFVRSGEACGVLANVSWVPDGQDQAFGILDLATGRVTQTEQPAQCPVRSHSGRLAALALRAGGTVVVDLSSGDTVEVARQGHPLAWSTDDTRLVVWGNGTYVVEADGSGGNEASIDASRLCVLGDSGTVLALVRAAGSQAASVVHYSVDEDSARTIEGVVTLGSACEVDEGASWVVTGRSVIDLADGQGGDLRMPELGGGELRLVGSTTSALLAP